MPALEKAFTIIRSGFPQFSGVTGQIDHGITTRSGAGIDEAGALRVAAVWIANSLLADEIAGLTAKIVLREDKSREPQQPPALKALWGEPNPDQTRFGIEASETLSMTLWGASYTMLGWTRSGNLDVRWPIDPANIRLERLDDQGLKLTSAGQGELVNRPGLRPEFSYAPMYTLPGKLEPVSPVRMAAELAGLALSYEQTAARLMARGLNPSAILTAGETIAQTDAEALSNRLERLHGGSANSGGVAVLGGKDLKLERLTMSLADAEFIAQNEYVFKVLLAMWRVPPTVAGMVDKPSTWGSGIAEFSRGLERFTLRPLVQRKDAADEKYITQWVDPRLQVRRKFESLLSAAPKERAEIQRLRLTNGLTSVERILAQEDEPPFDDDETVYSQLAFATGEERSLEMLQRRARAAAELVRAGVDQAAAFRSVGIDPETFEPMEE